MHMSGLRRFVEEKIELLDKVIEQCFAHMEQPLQEGVQIARTSYRRILGAYLAVSDPVREPWCCPLRSVWSTCSLFLLSIA